MTVLRWVTRSSHQVWPYWHSLVTPDEVLFTDRSSFIQDRIWYAEAAVVTQDKTIWAWPLSRQTSDQQAELLALTGALCWGKDKTMTIHTNWYYKTRDPWVYTLLILAGKEMKIWEEALDLLRDIWLPKTVSTAEDSKKGIPQKPVATKQLIWLPGSNLRTSGASPRLGSPVRAQLTSYLEYSLGKIDSEKQELARQYK